MSKQHDQIQPFVELVASEMKAQDFGNLPWKRDSIALEAAWYRPSPDDPFTVCFSAQRLGDKAGETVERDITIDATNGSLAEALRQEITKLLQAA